MAQGPAHRVQKGSAGTEHYKQTEQAAVEATYFIERAYQVAHPDISHFFSGEPHAIAVEMMKDETGGEWDISGAAPSEWSVSVYADADAMLASAEQAETEQARPASDILLEWAEYGRAPSNACLDAYERLTGNDAPVGEA